MCKSRLGVTILCAIASLCLCHGYEFCNDSVPVKGSTRRMPHRGYMTFFTEVRTGEASDQAILSSLTTFLKRGGRLIETSRGYGNTEHMVGLAVRESGVPREEIWLMTKVEVFQWLPTLGSPAAWVLQQVDKILNNMGVDYVDVMCLHLGPDDYYLEVGIPLSDHDHLDMWRGLIEARRLGKILHLCAYMHSQLEVENLMQIEAPAVAELLNHPWMPDGQKAYAEWLRDSGIVVVTPGAFLYKYFPGSKEKVAVGKEVGSQYGATDGQVSMQWNLQQGFVVTTGLYHPQYMLEDAVCMNFTVTEHDVAVLHSQSNWPCFAVTCFGQYLPGCRTPDKGPHKHVWPPQRSKEYVKCLLWHSFPSGEASTQSVRIKVSTLLTLIASFSSIVTAILCFHRRGVKANIDLSMPFME